MKNLFLLINLFIFASCSSTPEVVDEENITNVNSDIVTGKTGSAEDCVKNPALSKVWGECNVKKTIYKRTLQIRDCLQFERSGEGKTIRELLFKIHLLPTGRVSKVFVEGVDPQEKLLSSCVVKEISRLRFAAPPAGINPVIYFPFKVNEPSTAIYR